MSKTVTTAGICFSQKQLSVAIKNKRFECENYDKEAESGGRDPAYAGLELRSKCLTSNDIEKQFHGWYDIVWTKH